MFCEEPFKIRNSINGTTLAVLEEKQKVKQVFWTVIEWCGRKQHDFLSQAFQQPCVDTICFTDFLEVIIFARATIAEPMGFIHND